MAYDVYIIVHITYIIIVTNVVYIIVHITYIIIMTYSLGQKNDPPLFFPEGSFRVTGYTLFYGSVAIW